LQIPKFNTPYKYFLNFNGVYLSCGINIGHNPCDLIYDYHGQTATIYWQPIGEYEKYHNLAYEVTVNDQIIYQFDKQLSYFISEQKLMKQQAYWFLSFYIFPLLLLLIIIIINNRKIKTLNQNTDDISPLQEEFLMSLVGIVPIFILALLVWYFMNF